MADYTPALRQNSKWVDYAIPNNREWERFAPENSLSALRHHLARCILSHLQYNRLDDSGTHLDYSCLTTSQVVKYSG